MSEDELLRKKVLVRGAPRELNYLESEGRSIVVYDTSKIQMVSINGVKIEKGREDVWDALEVKTSHYGETNPELIQKLLSCELILLNEVSRKRFLAEIGGEAVIGYTQI
jgi:hypothetical protein